MAEDKKRPDIAEEELKMPEEPIGGTAEPEQRSSVTLLVLGVLVVLLALILVGLYLWSTMLQNETPPPSEPATRPTAKENNEPESNNAEADVQALETMSTSDELSAIEADIESTDLDDIDAEMNQIEAELEESAQ